MKLAIALLIAALLSWFAPCRAVQNVPPLPQVAPRVLPTMPPVHLRTHPLWEVA